jgi:hypothetical protein
MGLDISFGFVSALPSSLSAPYFSPPLIFFLLFFTVPFSDYVPRNPFQVSEFFELACLRH